MPVKMIPEINESNVRVLVERVNDQALPAIYEQDDLEQQKRKDSLRIYRVSFRDDETKDSLITTVVDKISQVENDISESDIYVCAPPARVRWKGAGKQPILIKFVRRKK